MSDEAHVSLFKKYLINHTINYNLHLILKKKMYVQIYTNKTRKLYIRPNWLHITFFLLFSLGKQAKKSNFNGLRAASV